MLAKINRRTKKEKAIMKARGFKTPIIPVKVRNKNIAACNMSLNKKRKNSTVKCVGRAIASEGIID